MKNKEFNNIIKALNKLTASVAGSDCGLYIQSNELVFVCSSIDLCYSWDSMAIYENGGLVETYENDEISLEVIIDKMILSQPVKSAKILYLNQDNNENYVYPYDLSDVDLDG